MTPTALIAQCAECPFLAAAASEEQLNPLTGEHTHQTGHAFAVSRVTHTRRG